MLNGLSDKFIYIFIFFSKHSMGAEGGRCLVQRLRREILPFCGSCDRKRVVEYGIGTVKPTETTSPV